SQRGAHLLALGRAEEAEADFREVQSLLTRQVRASRDRARAAGPGGRLQAVEEYGQAIDRLEGFRGLFTILETEGELADCLLERANVYFELGNLWAAKADQDRAVEILGGMRLVLGDQPAAEGEEDAPPGPPTREHPGLANAYLSRADTLAQMGLPG